MFQLCCIFLPAVFILIFSGDELGSNALITVYNQAAFCLILLPDKCLFLILHLSISAGLFWVSPLITDQLLPKILKAAIDESNLKLMDVFLVWIFSSAFFYFCPKAQLLSQYA